jgi:Leucine-rich repeat (LRR) protein
VIDALAKSPLCEVLLMAGNPVCGSKSFASRAVAVLPRLAQLDSVQIDVALRLKSLRNAGNSFQKKRIELVHWDLRVCESASVRAMREWQPAALTSLALVDMGLTEFHVGALVGLRDLNLSKNAIASTVGCGLEALPKLRRVNLAANRLSSSKMLEPFPLCASLMSVALRDNRDGSKELGNYRALLIYMTRYLAGSNRASGLQEIDGKPIAIKERVAAMTSYGNKKDLPAFTFETHVVNYIGRAQMRDANYVANIRELQLPNAAISEVSLRGMQHLEFLDLSGNHIVAVGALEDCVRLRFVNLSGNAELDAKHTVGVMAKAQQRLEQLSLCVLAAGHKRHPDSPKYRQYVLTALLQRNRKLDWLDTRPVTVDERAAAYAAALGAKATPHEIEKYRFYCALVQNCTMPMMRRLHPSDVLGGSQFDATQITILRQMASHSLRHVDFAAFVNLEELNLAHNQLGDITKLGIDQLRKLRVLALHNNQIANPLEQVAQFLDGFQRLECVALRNNPCMKSPAERTRLIGLMRSLHKARCSLRVLDTEISIKERVAAWAQLGGSAEATERLRFEAVMYQRLPPDVPPERIESLDLTDSGMRTVDISPYTALTCLLLNGNALTTLVGIGLEAPQRLKVLDLRNNQLSNLVEVAKLVSNLPRLATLGVAGNPWATRDKSGYRHALLQLMPQLAERECALKVIDEERIGADEIIAASKSSKLVTTDKHLVRFQVLMLTRVPSGYRPSDITELNLSKAQLDTVDLSACPLLVKLSLARNELKSLKSANLHRLLRLRALDVSHNQLKDVAEFAAVLALLPRLAVLLWVQNPLAGSPNNATPNAAAPKVSGAKALLPLSTLSSSQLSARESLFTKLAARRMGFNNVDDVHSVPLVKTRAGITIDVASLPLQVVDGRRVGVDELCEAMKSDKRFKKDDVEDARLNIAVRRAGASRGTVRTLDLSFCGFSSSLEALRGLRSLQSLNLSNNQLTKLEPGWLAPLVELEELDLRNNKFAALKQLLQVLVQACPSLRVLYVENATKNAKETAPGTEYPMKVCAVLRQLESCDGLANPYGVPLKTIKLAQQKRATLARERGATDAPVAASKAAKKATIRIQRAPTAPAPVAPSAVNPELAGVRDLDDDNNDADDDRPVAAYAGYDLGYMTMGLDMINH